MCEAYEDEHAFVGWLENNAPWCPRCKKEKALIYPHCGPCQKWAYQSALRGRPECSCDDCKSIKPNLSLACKCGECKKRFGV